MPLRGPVGTLFDPIPRNDVRVMLWASPPRFCHSNASLDAIHCVDFPEETETQTTYKFDVSRFADHLPGAPTHVITYRGALHRAGGDAPAIDTDVWAATVEPDGGVIWIGGNKALRETDPGADYALWRSAPGGKPKVLLPSMKARGGIFKVKDNGVSLDFPWLVHPWLLFPSKAGVQAMRVSAEGVGAPTLALPFVEGERRPEFERACSFGDGVALVFSRGRDPKRGGLVLFAQGSEWKAVESGPARMRVDPDPVDRPARIDCSRDGVGLSWVERAGRTPEGMNLVLRRIRCRSSGCQSWTSPAIALPGTERRNDRYVDPDPQLASLGDRLLLLWSTPEGLRLRTAGEDGIATAPVTAVTDFDPPHGGFYGGAEIQTRGEKALLFVRVGDLSTPEKTAILRVAEDGSLSSVREDAAPPRQHP